MRINNISGEVCMVVVKMLSKGASPTFLDAIN
jgi:hypothetical protein